jgi:hypothetical protein
VRLTNPNTTQLFFLISFSKDDGLPLGGRERKLNQLRPFCHLTFLERERERGKVGGWEIIKKLRLKLKTTKSEETERWVELKTNLGHLS